MKNRPATIHPDSDPAMQALLKRLSPAVANSFTTEQLIALASVVGARGGRVHAIDVRSTIKLPFIPFSFYLVFLMGKNRRRLNATEQFIAVLSMLFLIALACTFVVCFLFFALYLLKSALGIDILTGYSTGLWDWFKS
ncbi:3-phosphoshikimate 1-carboxyvinyltransferase [Salinicola halimionae]|uniref:3-phosphoshikimate 1-carboxyvinyltransferase n=1 Tax=Salinicola halimionae TaxID=1949081 RepID=UPI001CB6DF22|nr:3-phosphoshikimate 1-carboxyvinyltransferase [Salinicola halimionae]